jgi:hypothetical protein
VIVFVWLAGASPGQTTAADPSPRPVQLSLSDPQHLWNQIRYRFHVRLESEMALGPDKLAFEPNDHDPLHWSRIWFPKPGPVDYLLKGTPYREAIALLDEFLTKDGEKLDANPLQRAFLQHDLWAVFDYLSDPRWLDGHETKQYRVERRELYRRIARAIERLALTNEQIGKLPDNYTAVVDTQKYPPKFDPERPDQAFLPPDLWEPEGPWVLVSEWADNPLAIRHTAFFGGRSTFAVFLRLPEGRAQTVKYLEQLREWKPKTGEAIPPEGQAIPPQVPPQTQFALARRMMLVNNAGKMVPTRLTEMFQIRVLPNPAKPGVHVQTFMEYRLRRQNLESGKGDGLSAVGTEERDRSDMLELGPRNDEERHVPILRSCLSCHSDQGILSMNSYTGSMDNVSRLRGIRSLVESPLKRQEDETIYWKQKQYSWGLLTGFNESKPGD